MKPGYWMHETSGVLRPVVERYLDGAELDGKDMGLMKSYLAQWMQGDWRGDEAARLRAEVDKITTTADLRRWLDDALEIGIDPL